MSVTFYVSHAAGSDSNSGSSSGSAKVSGTGAATTASDAWVDLSADTPDLSAVNANTDTIYLSGRSDGRNSGPIFLITSVDDANDKVQVSPTPSSTASGISWSIGGAVQTLAALSYGLAAGDKAYVKADENYIEQDGASGAVLELKSAGTSSAPIVIEGYKTTPGDSESNWGDATYRATIDADSQTLANAITVDGAVSTSLYTVLKHLRCTGGSGNGINLTASQRVK